MGKHSAPSGRASRRPAGSPSAPSTPRAPSTPSQPRETPPVLKQTAALLTLAVVVVMFALVWTGLGPTAALGLGIGLLVLGAVAFLVVRQAGLLGTAPAAALPDEATPASGGTSSTVTPSP